MGLWTTCPSSFSEKVASSGWRLELAPVIIRPVLVWNTLRWSRRPERVALRNTFRGGILTPHWRLRIDLIPVNRRCRLLAVFPRNGLWAARVGGAPSRRPSQVEDPLLSRSALRIHLQFSGFGVIHVITRATCG